MIPPTYIFKAIHEQRLLDGALDADAPPPFDGPPPRGLLRLAQALRSIGRALGGSPAPRPVRN